MGRIAVCLVCSRRFFSADRSCTFSRRPSRRERGARSSYRETCSTHISDSPSASLPTTPPERTPRHRARPPNRKPRRFVRIDPAFPEQPPGLGIQRVKRSDLIGKQNRVTPSERTDDGRGAHRPVRLKRPVEAAGFRVHRVNDTAGASDKKHAVVNRRRGIRRDVSSKSKRPFQFKIANLLSRQ